MRVGKIKRQEVIVKARYYDDFNNKFEEAMDWIDENIEVLAINLISANTVNDDKTSKYEVIFREIEEN